jgi:hypothetical protein
LLNTTTKKTTTFYVGSPDPGLLQAQKCGRVKYMVFFIIRP